MVGRRRVKWAFYCSFEGMEMGREGVGKLKS
jgi:hypothetical protein